MTEEKKLYRNKQEGKIFGVCAGLADYFGIDVTLIRLILVVLVLGFGFGLLAYFVAALIIPVNRAWQIVINLLESTSYGKKRRQA